MAAIANCAKWDYDRALAFCQEATELDFTWVEEPLPMEAYEDLARLRSAVGVAISGGELNNQGLPEFKHMIARGCYDWYQPDAVMVGGISETWGIMQALDGSDGAYSPHTWSNGIGFAINLQLFAASKWRESKYLEYPLSPPGWVPSGRDGLLTQPFTHVRGRLKIPELPGLGFEIDPAQLRRHARCFYTATKVRVAVSTVLDRGVSMAKKLGATRDARLAARSEAVDAMVAAGEDPLQQALAELSPEG